jgi:hypothetical protein
MGLARSSFYAEPEGKPRDEEIVAEIRAITDAFEGYGYRRVDTELRHRGFVVNAKKVRRLMREHDLNPRRRRVSSAPPRETTTIRAVRSWPGSSKPMALTSSGVRRDSGPSSGRTARRTT